MDSAPPEPDKKKLTRQLLMILGVIAALFLVFTFLPVEKWLNAFSEWVQGLGWIGYVVFPLIYVLAAIVLTPGSILTLAAGAAYGLVKGFVVISIGSTLGAAAAFLIGRHAAREKVEKRFAGDPRFAAIDAAVGERGAKIVILLRLSPAIPFNMLNYLLGLTSVRFRSYVWASWLGMIPGTILYVYLGSLGRRLGGETTTGEWAYLGAGLVATVAVTIHLTRVAKQALAKRDVEAEA